MIGQIREQLSIPSNVRIAQIAGFPDYYVTDRGDVISCRRDTPIVLRPGKERGGRLHVTLYGQPSERFIKKVHHLVLESFGYPRPEGMLCRHLNDIPDDNRLENLRWGTDRQNKQDALRNGAQYGACGASSGNAKLTEREVVEIRNKYVSGEANTVQLSEEYDVARPGISKIVKGESYPNCGGPTVSGDLKRKVTQTDKEEIRQLYATGDYTQRELAANYPVSRTRIGQIIRGM